MDLADRDAPEAANQVMNRRLDEAARGFDTGGRCSRPRGPRCGRM
jgi:hypothetical protein